MKKDYFDDELQEGERWETDEEAKERIVKTLKKRRKIYLFVMLGIAVVGAGLIALSLFFFPSAVMPIYIVALVLWGIGAGMLIMAHNQVCYEASDGKKKGGGIVSILIGIVGMILVPFGFLWLCKKSKKLSELVLGIELEDF